MEQTILKLLTEDQIKENNKSAKKIFIGQTLRLQKLFAGKISEMYSIDEEKIDQILKIEFSDKALGLIDNLFSYFERDESDFYSKNMNTVDLIFNTLKDNRTKVIYLDNIIKKINEKKENVKEILEQIPKEDESISEENLQMIFGKSIQKILNSINLSKEKQEELVKIAFHYYQLYQSDIASTIEQYLDSNKKTSIDGIEEEMDKQRLRGNKTSAVARIEREIADNSKKVIDSLLEESIKNNKKKSREELKICSSSIIGIIFKSLPEEYKKQQALLEVIVDTNINERLGKILDEATDDLSQKLKTKNHDVIENEFYEEKRYKDIKPYEIDLDQIDKVYQDVLHEITIAYDIPTTNNSLKRLSLVILSESNSTKNVFKNSINHIRAENEVNLSQVLGEMKELSKKVSSMDKRNNSAK